MTTINISTNVIIQRAGPIWRKLFVRNFSRLLPPPPSTKHHIVPYPGYNEKFIKESQNIIAFFSKKIVSSLLSLSPS